MYMEATDPATDIGNAARFAQDHHDQILYSQTLGWMVWDGMRWHRDDTGEVERLARDTLARLAAEAVRTGDKKLASWATRSANKSRIDAMVSLGQSEIGIARRSEIFDANPRVFNTASGLIELKTGECRPTEPGDYVTMAAPVFYRREAECPVWLTFLDRVLGGNLDLIEFLQRAVGYSLTGLTIEQCLFLLYGSGANGKTTLLEALRGILGNYAQQTPTETLLLRGNGGSGIPNDLARLRGARLVCATEIEDGHRLAESLVKQLTGGDTITARFLHREFFEFRPQFKLWIATNHKPMIRGTDYAIWRRIRLVPFEVQIPPEERDAELPAKLAAESTGILAWAVEGCLQWQKKGLDAPEAVTGRDGRLPDFDGHSLAVHIGVLCCCLRASGSRPVPGLSAVGGGERAHAALGGEVQPSPSREGPRQGSGPIRAVFRRHRA